ncbi:o-succinylbenzoate synthase [Leucobacter sp. M11]|uniref:o-succinylbenzoate synthase n=1 Tax=Leucobacter sp. M11 TaxID=2993565 RepID=UPI002D80F6B6|nr:o-succinylbenzoate synthase [Leucobacter sp. M11]MEB4614662.1 o-succinylbenzoate synthase [Leucobacter sp. M11]
MRPASRPAASLPELAWLLDTVRVVAIPTRTRFRGVTVREAAIFSGPEGATEFSPFPEYADAEAAAWLAAAIEYGWQPAPEPLRDTVEVNATVPAVGPDRVPEILARFPGCRTVKVKVAERGESLDDDLARVRAVRAHAGSDARIRVDANGGWSLDEARVALDRLAPLDLDYAEQPCATVPELAQLRAELAGAVRIAADESVRRAEDPLAVARAGAADLLIVKAQPLGGIRQALAILAAAGLPAVVSSALDTSVGISMGARLAACLPEPAAAGLGTVALLAGDIVTEPRLPVRGRIPSARATLDPAALERFAAAPERVAWWRARISRCHALLAAQPAG